jgi:hypothetical protein
MTVKVKVTNHAPGLQGIRHAGGVSYLRPGASGTFAFDEATGRRTERLPFLALEAVDQDEPEPLAEPGDQDGGEPQLPPGPVVQSEPSAAAALLAELEAEGLHFQTFKKRAGEILGPDALPDTKDEIVAALKAHG